MLGKRLINSNTAAAGGACTTDTLQILGDTSCVAYYKMSDATDESGNYDGTPTSVNFNVAGKFGNAAQFNGSSSRINLPQTYGAEGENFSYSFWFKTTTSGGSIYDSQNIISKRNGANTFHLNITNANTLLVSDWSGTMNKQSSTTVTDGVWRHIVFTYSNSSGLVYINGSVETSMSFTVNLPTQSISLGNNIGNWDGNSRNFGGSIDQIRVFNKTLSSTEVTTLSNEVYCVPTIVPTANFNTVLWSNGVGAHQTPITGVGFQPDWTWIKMRDAGQNHVLTDSVRGVTKTLESNTTDSEETVAQGLTAFNSDGFALGNDARFNSDERSGVAWNWYAPTAESIGASGSRIASTIKKNVDAGFSIVKHTGTGVVGTVGHGLDSAPELIIYKQTSSSSVGKNWIVYASPLGNTGGLMLNLTGSKFTDTDSWNNTTPTSTVFTLGAGDDGYGTQTNVSGKENIAYCFHSVDGMSRVGSYVGNNSTDGPNIVTGFRPAFVMFKATNAVGGNTFWVMLDNKRDGTTKKRLYANVSAAEDTALSVDFLSNGFKINTSNSDVNANFNYIFLAIAEEGLPYVTRNATNPFGDASEKALYKFEDNATDAEGNYSSTTLPNVTFATGYIDKAAVFNGSSSEIELPSIINFGTNNYTFSFWFNADVVGSGRVILGNLSGSGILINIESNNKLRFYHSGGTAANVETLNVLSTNTWYHCACVMNHSSKAEMYLNGQLQGSSTGSNLGTGSGADLIIGNYPNGDYWFDGKIDQLRIFNRVLDDGEVMALYLE